MQLPIRHGRYLQEYLVISGDKSFGNYEKWEFITDKEHMSHVVPVIVGITIPELRNIVLTELSGDIHQLSTSASLSYWPPDTKELATGLTVPLVIITNNVAVDYSLTHLDLNKATNLFVKFASVTKIPGSSYVDDTGFTFTTPTNQINHKTNFEEGTSSTNHMNPIGNSPRYASSAGSKLILSF
ncbi:hypothetical protein Bca4012_031860 [Brassica carinata]